MMWGQEMVALNDNKNPALEQAPQAGTKKPTLLFVDYAVPQYDLFAGSRTNFMYLEMLAEMGLEIFFLAEDFHPLEPYTSELKQMGIEPLVGDWYRQNWESWLSENGQRIDFVFFHKPDPAAFFLPAVRHYSNAAILYQCHDLHYLRLQRKAEIEGDKTILEEANRYEKKEDFIFANSDVLLTFSEVEEKVIKAKFPHKSVFTVPLFFYRELANPKRDFEVRRNMVFVGACAHTPNRDAVAWFCSEVFPLIQAQIPDIVFEVVGAEPPAEIASLESQNINILGRVSDEQLHDLYANVRMMVVPLRFGAGVKGEVIEAMHNGLPLVSTSIGLEGIKAVDHIIKAQDTAEGFAAEVISLYNDSDKLRDLSQRGAEFIEDNFSLNNTVQLMNKILAVSKEQGALRVADQSRVWESHPAREVSDARIIRLQGQLRDQKQEMRELEQKVVERERHVEEILNSTSWKFSFPVRWVKQRLLDLKKRFSG
jgi:glycosyltransferase involved in cell wall biosynthesis